MPKLEQQIIQLPLKDKLYIIQLLAQSLTIHNNHIHLVQTSKLSAFFHQFPLVDLTEELDISHGCILLKTLIESLQSEMQTATLPTSITEYPLPQFYGCIQDETLFRHPQGNQPEREPIL